MYVIKQVKSDNRRGCALSALDRPHVLRFIVACIYTLCRHTSRAGPGAVDVGAVVTVDRISQC